MINPLMYEDSEMTFEEHSKPVKTFATELADILNRNYDESANLKFKMCQLPEIFYKIENNGTKERFDGDMLHNDKEPYFDSLIGNKCLKLENPDRGQVEDVYVTSDIFVSACSSTINTDYSKALGYREVSSELYKPSKTFNFERVCSSYATGVPGDKVKDIDEIDTKITGETLGKNCDRTKNIIAGVEPVQERECVKQEISIVSEYNSPLKVEKLAAASTHALSDSIPRSTPVFPVTFDEIMVNSNTKSCREGNLSSHSSCDKLNDLKETSYPQLFYQSEPLSSIIKTNTDTSACVSKDILKRDIAAAPDLSVEKPHEMSKLTDKCVAPLVSGHNSTHIVEKSKILDNNCLYNQSGKLCMVFGKRYIVSKICDREELVSLVVSHIRYVHVCGGFKVVWRGSTAVPIDEIKDGSDVIYDAILSPDQKSFSAMILWIHKKPQLIPLSPEHTYLFISCHSVPFTNVSVTSGISRLKAVCDSKEMDVYLSGDIFHLSKNCSESNINARITKVIEGGCEGLIEYYCNCIMVESYPPKDKQKLQRSEVYKKLSSGALTQETEYSYLLVDIPGVLEKLNDCYRFICELTDYSYYGKILLEELPGMNHKGQITAMAHIEYCKELNIFTIMLIHFPEQNKTFNLARYCIGMEIACSESSVKFQNQGAFDCSSSSQVNNCTESQESKGCLKNEIFENVSCTYCTRTKDYIFLNVKGKSKDLSKGIAALHLSNGYVENKSLLEHVARSGEVPLNDSVWYCRLEAIDTKIDGIQVKYIAKLGWQGKKPVPIDTTSKNIIEASDKKYSVKFENKVGPGTTSISQVKNYTGSPVSQESNGVAKNKKFNAVSCTYSTRTKDYILLNVKGKSKDLQKGIAALHLSNGYLENKSLSEHVARSGDVPLNDPVWYCRLEAINTEIDGIQVEYIAKLAWQGKKPVAIDANSKKEIKAINQRISVKFENKVGPGATSIPQVKNYNGPPVGKKSNGDAKNKVFDGVSCTYYKRTKRHIFLNIKGKSIGLQKGIAALHLSNGYIKNKSLSEHVAHSGDIPFNHFVWNCRLEAIKTIIDGIKVKYIATLAWQGKKPVPIDTTSKEEIKAINHKSNVKFENKVGPSPTRLEVKIYKRSPIGQDSNGNTKNKVFDGVSGTYYTRTKHYVFLKIKGKSKDLPKGIAALQLANGYVGNKSLSEHVAHSGVVPLNQSVWYCRLEATNTIIDGIQVEYIAKLAWQGKKPVFLKTTLKEFNKL